jgi:hypothetical protein
MDSFPEIVLYVLVALAARQRDIEVIDSRLRVTGT